MGLRPGGRLGHPVGCPSGKQAPGPSGPVGETIQAAVVTTCQPLLFLLLAASHWVPGGRRSHPSTARFQGEKSAPFYSLSKSIGDRCERLQSARVSAHSGAAPRQSAVPTVSGLPGGTEAAAVKAGRRGDSHALLLHNDSPMPETGPVRTRARPASSPSHRPVVLKPSATSVPSQTRPPPSWGSEALLESNFPRETSRLLLAR